MGLYARLKRKVREIILKSSDMIGYKGVEDVVLEELYVNKEELLDTNISQINNNIKEELNDIKKESLFYEEIEFIEEELNYHQELDSECKFEEDVEYDEAIFLEDLEYSEQLKNNSSLDCNYSIEQINIEEIKEDFTMFKEELDFNKEIEVLDDENNLIENCSKSKSKDISLFYLNLISLERFILIDRYFIDDIDTLIQLKIDIEKSVDIIEDLMHFEDIECRECLLEIQEVLNDKKYLCYENIINIKNKYETSVYLQNNIEYYLESIQDILLELTTLIEDNLNI